MSIFSRRKTMNAQQQAAAVLFVMIATSNSTKERKELMAQQHSFVAVVNGEKTVVAHGEFFGADHPPFEGVVTTTQGVAARDITGGMLFIPFEVPVAAPVPVAEAPAAVEVPVAAPVPVAEAPAPALLTTRTTRVAFGEQVEFWNSTFTVKVEFEAPSSGAVIEERFKDGSVIVRFVGATRQTWTI
jgi:hypothetical protein